jgi:hypothetical protein
MFDLGVDDRLSAWASLRHQADLSKDPLTLVWEFWSTAPFIPYNNKFDPYYQASWPSPWEIIVENRYDDFTKALMIGQSLKMTKRFASSKIEIKTLVDNANNRQYNIVSIDEEWIINYNDNGPELLQNIPESFLLENIIELTGPR